MRSRKPIGVLLSLLSLLALSPPGVQASGPQPAQEAILTFRYAKTADRYQVHSTLGGPLVEWRDGRGVWVAVYEERPGWYRIGAAQWVPADQVWPAAPSTLQGIDFRASGMEPNLGWVVHETLNIRSGPGAEFDIVGTAEQYQTIPIYDQQQSPDGVVWYRVGDGMWVHAGFVGRVHSQGRPPAVGAGERWIEVDLSEQVLMAHIGDEMVYAALVATGLPQWKTVEGLSRIWVKARHAKMSGGSRQEGDSYWLSEVPWIMYFDRGYGLHGAYWHDAFGAPRSHGCVNLSPYDAWWLFHFAGPDAGARNWTLATAENPGTWVYVHD